MKFIDITHLKKNKYRIDKPGQYIFFMFNRSGNLQIDINAENAKVYIFGLYTGKSDEVFTLNTIQHHMVGNSISDLLIKGVFTDSSKFIYKGLIRIDKKAQKSNAYQKNQNLVLSSQVYVDSNPYLEILADDVRCTHGSTTGGLDKDQLYYVMTRGIDKIKAEKMLIEGFIKEIEFKIRDLGYEGSLSR